MAREQKQVLMLSTSAATVLLALAAVIWCCSSRHDRRPNTRTSGHQRVRTTDDDIDTIDEAERERHGERYREKPTADSSPPTLVGQRVVIRGLIGRPEMNGSEGVATRFSQAQGRYIVMTAGGVESAIKEANLRPLRSR